MFTMDQIHLIRELYYGQGKNLSEIAAAVGCDWRTARKYVDMEDFSPRKQDPQGSEPHSSKLDPYKPLIDKWLADDKKAPRKQRHTAKRIYDRLQEETEGFDASYRLVADYVSARKKELNLCREPGSIPLCHRPGEAQADFGFADFYENGRYHKNGKYLVLSFPYSNGAYLQLNYGENLECLLEGLQAMFEYIGGVPTEIWFDNTSTIITRIIKNGGREVTKRFQLFAEHYRFHPVFMNPGSGNEKGNVENKVGYLRRNELVPVPEFPNLRDKNRELLESCDRDMDREHYDKEGSIHDLFREDREALLPLPPVRFDTAQYTSALTDRYGKFTLDSGAHRYSVSPAFSGERVNLKITSSEVLVMDSDMHEIVRHRRLYSQDETESMDWLPYLKYIARRPRSLRNSGIYDMMPESMRNYLDLCPNSERGKILKVLADLTDRTGFDSAVRTVGQAIRYHAADPDSLENLYRRIYSDVPELPPLEGDQSIPALKVINGNTDLSALDRLLQEGGEASHG